MKYQVVKMGSGFLLFESDNKEDCVKWQKEHKDISTLLWENFGMRFCHL